LATGVAGSKKSHSLYEKEWCARGDSNSRPFGS
jgi:hypothetical protein